jgi:hypothetical protein
MFLDGSYKKTKKYLRAKKKTLIIRLVLWSIGSAICIFNLVLGGYTKSRLLCLLALIFCIVTTSVSIWKNGKDSTGAIEFYGEKHFRKKEADKEEQDFNGKTMLEDDGVAPGLFDED